MVLAISYFVLAWTEPSQAPPGGNVLAPLNVGSAGQSKAGGLILNTGGAATGLIVQYGNVGIGTTAPGAKLDVSGEIRATGAILSNTGKALYERHPYCSDPDAPSFYPTCQTRTCDAEAWFYYRCNGECIWGQNKPDTCNNTFVGRLISGY